MELTRFKNAREVNKYIGSIERENARLRAELAALKNLVVDVCGSCDCAKYREECRDLMRDCSDHSGASNDMIEGEVKP